MDRLSEAGAIAGSKEPRTCPADVASPPRIAPPLLRGSRAAAGAGALPGARRRCKAGKRTHGRATRTCLALLAATALLAMAAPAQAQTEVWSATLTPGDLGGGILGCSNGVSHARCSNTSFLSEDSFNHDSTDYNIAGLFVRSSGQLEFSVDADITTATAALILVVGSTSFVLADATSINTRSRYWSSSGVSLTAGTDITVKLTAPGTPNTAATGAPTITGTAQVGKTLTAVTTGIMDADGLTSPTYTYQWIRMNGTEADISGANSSTYTLDAADLGKTIKVRVTFTDDASNSETLTSAATATVAADTTPPEVVRVTVDSTGSSVTLVFDEHLDDDAASGLHLSAISLTAGGQAVTIPFADFHLQRQALALTYRYSTIKQGQTVVVSYTDPTAGDDTDTLQDVAGNDVASFTTGQSGVPAVTNNSTNNAATGEPAISGTAQAGQELTADASPIMDTDGLASVSYSYQWVRVDADGTSNEEAISGEIAATYTLTNDDVGKRIKVKVSFTDELSGLEMRTSAAYPSSGTVTAASTTAPALTSVTVTSTPHKTTDTYGAREHIEFSMTFDAPVTVTGDPTFAFDLGGPTTASWYAGSGTVTLRFSHAVSGGSSGDEDTNGISWAQNAIALNGGTIAGTDNAVAAVLTHVAQSNLADHKVDGRTTAVTAATVTDVVVTSTPMLMASGSSTADTYGFGETIVITVTVSEAVEVEGDPVFRFSLTNPGGAANNPQATYDRTRSIATTIVFTYTVQAGDMDNNGIWIGTHSQTFSLDANDRIRTASQQIDIDRSHLEKGTQGGHKVDGSLGAPTVPPDPTAPTLVSATATTLTIEWTHPGDGGSPLTRNFIEYRVEGTTDWTNWYRGETPTPVTRTVITNLAAGTAYDVRVHSTNAIGNSQWVQSATAFSTLAGTASCPVPTFTGRRKIWTGVLTMGDFTEIPFYSLRGYDSLPDSGDGGGLDPATFTLGLHDYEIDRIALDTTVGANDLNFFIGRGEGRDLWRSTVGALRLHVCNTNFDFDVTSTVTNHLWTTDLDWSGVTTRTVHLSLPLNRPATGAPVITGTATVGQVLAVDVTGIEDEDGLHDVEYTYQWVRVDADGTSNEEDITVETDATYTLTDDDLGKKVKIEVSFPDDFGSDEQRTSAPTATVGAAATGPPTVNDVAVTSTPASGTTYYLAGEVIEFTVTFSAPVTVTATPKFAFRLGAATRQAAYASGSESAALVFARTVQAGEVDRNGISWNALALALDGGTITQTGATTGASLTHAEQAPLEGHRVDAAPPMQVSASVHGMSLVLVYDEPLDPASMPATGAYTVTATVGATTTNPAVSEVSIYGIWVTLALDAAPAAAATVTLAYAPPASNPVQDEAGNDAPAFSGQKVNGAAGNTAPTGAPTITGTAEVGQTLTAVTTGIMDADGLTSPTYTYQWIRVDGTEGAIAGENSSTYILVDADLGTTLKVKVTFADDLGHTETLTSAATATVGATATAPSVSAVAITSDPGPDGIYAEEDVIEITVTFSETVTVDTTNGTPSLALTVGRPRKPALYSPDSASVAQRFTYTVGDSDIDTDGVSIAAGRIALNGGTIQDHADNPSLLVYEAVPTQPGHAVDGVRPVLQGATVRGATLTLTYGEALDGDSTPAVSDFTVNVAGIERPLTEILLSGSTVLGDGK